MATYMSLWTLLFCHDMVSKVSAAVRIHNYILIILYLCVNHKDVLYCYNLLLFSDINETIKTEIHSRPVFVIIIAK